MIIFHLGFYSVSLSKLLNQPTKYCLLFIEERLRYI